MKPYPWLKLIKKSRVEPALEPPIWLGNHSNGEYFHEATPRERLIRKLILERADEGARKHGMDRRQFLASSMGVATSLATINWVAACGAKDGSMPPPGGSGAPSARSTAAPAMQAGAAGMGSAAGNAPSPAMSKPPMAIGPSGSAGPAPAPTPASGGTPGVGGVYNVGDPMDPACTSELMLNPEQEFVFDLQTHHVEQVNTSSYMSFLRSFQQSNCGGSLEDCFSRDRYIDLLFLQSNTTMSMLSAVPAVEAELPLSNNDIAASRDYVNMLAHSERMVIQGQVLPNDNLQKQLDGMQRLVEELGVICWKVHTEWGPGNTWGNAPNGYWLDDEMVGIPFIEKARQVGVNTFCCHKGLPAPLFNTQYCSPRDLGPVAKAYPDTNWVCYHSAFQNGGGTFGAGEGAYQDGSMTGIDSLITVMKGSGIGPNQNIYAELAGVWNAIMSNPTEAAHVIGKLLLYVGENNVLWGSDAIWTARPQPYVDSFWNFEITQEFQDMYKYPALTPDIKRKVLGLNSARLFKIDPVARRCRIQAGAMANAKRIIDGEYGPLQWFGERPLGPTTRREFAMLQKLRQFLQIPG